MFGRKFRLFSLVGFEVSIDASWLILAALIVWSLAVGYFPYQDPGLETSTYWWMGVAGAVGLFGSIVLHELSHSLVARRYGLPMKGITLFIFGGVAEMSDQPPNPTAEWRMAAAGPAMSVLISIVSYVVYTAFSQNLGVFWKGIFGYLAWINILLAVFNLLPAFPLDGGRVLRAILWRRRGNLHSATRTASRWGSGFGMGLIILGVISIILGNFIGGLWWALIGMFLRGVSRASYQQMEIRGALQGEPISRFMRQEPISVHPSTSLETLLDDYFYRYYYNVFPVTDGEQLVGCVSVKAVQKFPRAEWSQHTVQELTEPADSSNTVSPDTDAFEVLKKMSGGSRRWIAVTNASGHLFGLVTLRDLMNYLAAKLELEEGAVGNMEGLEPPLLHPPASSDATHDTTAAHTSHAH